TPFGDGGEEQIPAETIPALVERFHDAYERRYGNRFPYVPVQGVTYRVQLVVPADKIEHVERDGGGGGTRARRPPRRPLPPTGPPSSARPCRPPSSCRARAPRSGASARSPSSSAHD